MRDLTPAIKKLLICAHGCMVLSEFTSHQLKVVSEDVVKLLIVVSNDFQAAAL
jgi:hypothetical protein